SEAPAPAALCASRGDPLVLPSGLDELRALPDIVGNGFLDVGVLARLHCPDGGQRMPMIGRSDGDRVDVFVVEDAAHVGLELRTLAGPFEYRGGCGLGAAAIHIDQRGDLYVGNRENLADMRGTARAYPDDGDTKAVVGAGPRLSRGGGS